MQLGALFRTPASGLQRSQALEDEYAYWRRETKAVAQSYRRWNHARRDERSLAHAAYLAALDRDERAASEYQRVAEQAQGSIARRLA